MFPDFFKMNDDGKAEVKKSSITDSGKLEEIKGVCAVSAISANDSKK